MCFFAILSRSFSWNQEAVVGKPLLNRREGGGRVTSRRSDTSSVPGEKTHFGVDFAQMHDIGTGWKKCSKIRIDLHRNVRSHADDAASRFFSDARVPHPFPRERSRNLHFIRPKISEQSGQVGSSDPCASAISWATSGLGRHAPAMVPLSQSLLPLKRRTRQSRSGSRNSP